jgi:hypothetical protein
MDPRMGMIIHGFELRKLDRICNNRECKKPPSKKIMIFETDDMTDEKKELVILHLCTYHSEGLKRFLNDLAELTEKGKTIGTETIETGYMTY